jgi:hypothetical protein
MFDCLATTLDKRYFKFLARAFVFVKLDFLLPLKMPKGRTRETIDVLYWMVRLDLFNKAF